MLRNGARVASTAGWLPEVAYLATTAAEIPIAMRVMLTCFLPVI